MTFRRSLKIYLIIKRKQGVGFTHKLNLILSASMKSNKRLLDLGFFDEFVEPEQLDRVEIVGAEPNNARVLTIATTDAAVAAGCIGLLVLVSSWRKGRLRDGPRRS